MTECREYSRYDVLNEYMGVRVIIIDTRDEKRFARNGCHNVMPHTIRSVCARLQYLLGKNRKNIMFYKIR